MKTNAKNNTKMMINLIIEIEVIIIDVKDHKILNIPNLKAGIGIVRKTNVRSIKYSYLDYISLNFVLFSFSKRFLIIPLKLLASS